MFRVKRSPTKALCLLLLVVFGPVGAAPTDEAPADGQAGVAREPANAGPLERVTTPQVNSGSRTVDLLIELQGKQAELGIKATERAAPRTDVPSTKAEALARLAATPAPSFNNTGLFDGPAPVASPGATPAGSRAPDWHAGGVTQNSPATPTPSPGRKALASEGQSYDEGRSGPLRAAVAWLRENRDWVVGVSVLLLVTVGLASKRKAQRKR
ncbi:MAG: hypothetical protein JNK55_22895 [Rubrivivax sp.]|nr:hypothetical protein [Rubrivivax sp.]